MVLKGFLLWTSMILVTNTRSQQLLLASQGESRYQIVLPQQPSSSDKKAALVLQDYFARVTGILLPMVNEFRERKFTHGFYIGATLTAKNDTEIAGMVNDGFILYTENKNIFIRGKGSKGTLYGVYTFIEKFLGCHKWDSGPARVPSYHTLAIPEAFRIKESPAFQYREVYMPPAFDDEYLDWHRLQRFELLWGLWGHSFHKLLPPSAYFKSHPEYYSLVNGERLTRQLCLSNPKVLSLVIEKLSNEMALKPAAVNWSISPNDDNGNCECDNCHKMDLIDGGPQGSLIRFVNEIASRFPTKKFFVLAYGYSAKPPVQSRPASNVYIQLSSIEAFRSKPLQTEKSAVSFRNYLEQWKTLTPNIFIWDYCAQFTNYLAPFPVMNQFQPNLSFLSQQGVMGVFEQGSGNTYTDMAELKTYLLSSLLWNPNANTDSLTRTFLSAYYGTASDKIMDYLISIEKGLTKSGTNLSIYGNPINDHASYLSPFALSEYYGYLDEAEKLTETDSSSLQHIKFLRMSLDYVSLQQAKFFGKDKQGIYRLTKHGDFVIDSAIVKKIFFFNRLCKAAKVNLLSEGGIGPDKYWLQWQELLATPAKKNLAAGAAIRYTHPFTNEYPAKRERTLVDETPGYADFSYNWQCFYGVPMEVNMDMGEVKNISTITLHFLEDARHWIFRPARVSVAVSEDGTSFQPLKIIESTLPKEDYAVNFIPFLFKVDARARYVKVVATNWPALPDWRYNNNKKPMIACDEIWVE